MVKALFSEHLIKRLATNLGPPLFRLTRHFRGICGINKKVFATLQALAPYLMLSEVTTGKQNSLKQQINQRHYVFPDQSFVSFA